MRCNIVLSLIFVAFLSVGVAFGQEKGGDDLRAAVQNPVASMYSLPFKNVFDFGAQDGDAYILNIQPVIPVTVGDWNLVNRIIAPIADVPGFVEGTPEIPQGVSGDGASGLGDINYSLFFSSVKV
ncbi:MAG: hypothetical protein JRF17_01975, partial [Deltaproteobacteria bacterium]|nr:hypothetical protein [Deltaproteobacteria bacterium]